MPMSAKFIWRDLGHSSARRDDLHVYQCVYCYDILYVAIYVRKPRTLVNVYCALKFLLEFEMTSSKIEKKLFKQQKKFLGASFYLI